MVTKRKRCDSKFQIHKFTSKMFCLINSFVVHERATNSRSTKCLHLPQKFPHPKTILSFSPPALTRCLRWRLQCWWFTALRTRSSTSPMAWPCTSAAPAPSSPCGWRGPATMTSSCTLSTWRDSSSSSPSSFRPLEGRPEALRLIFTHSKEPPRHLPASSEAN